MDNLSSHKVSGVRERIEQAGAELLYLPPYSPDLNPIEKAWAKLKQQLRAAKARSLRRSMTPSQNCFQPSDLKMQKPGTDCHFTSTSITK